MDTNIKDYTIHKELPSDWQNPSNEVFLKAEFLQALADNSCIGNNTGWQAHYIELGTENITLPCYIKEHSMGEYVFDWSWAEAYQKYGLDYYPKLLCAIPFTPVATDKFSGLKLDNIATQKIVQNLNNVCRDEQLSSWHINFITAQQAQSFANETIHIRHAVQFEWHNKNFTHFDDYLSLMMSRKRKMIKKERQKAQQQIDSIQQLTGSEITEKTLQAFYYCYQMTYLKRGRQGYLTYQFFKQLVETMGEHILLVTAEKSSEIVAAALFFYDEKTLYGRYWGCVSEIEFLHFELCFYQGIDFCIKNKLTRFNPGTQGEHKLLRGFEPTLTYSAHHQFESGFRWAIENFCAEERAWIQNYYQACLKRLPFK
ncbi:GNAT family N-acetyltransferase [Catenovulum sediminis]|uniref:GNAT family N-acetyltransferase n=1 Tax=Catenovulum sediminis TaxID=1740262 RepID=UPI00118168E1|nr:GNAT family N-acetyltransferase [Catenovulum sediminis]